MLETEWVKLHNRWKKCINFAKNLIFMGFLSVGIGTWFLPQMWMRFSVFGVWLMILGLLAYYGLKEKELNENIND